MSHDDRLKSPVLHLDYVDFVNELLGRDAIERRDTALRAASAEQRTRWERFFGLADSVAEQGASTQIPKKLVSEIEAKRPISEVVTDLRRESTGTPAELLNLGRALHEYGSTLLAAGKLDEARERLLESDEAFTSVMATYPATTSASSREASINGAAVLGRMLTQATLSNVYKTEGDPVSALSALRTAVDIAGGDPNRPPNVQELEAQLWAMQGILLTEQGMLPAAASAVETGIATLMPLFAFSTPLESWYVAERDPYRHGGQGVAAMLELLATISMRQVDVDAGVGLARMGVAVRRRYFDAIDTQQNAVGLATSLHTLGNCLRIARRPDEAARAFREAVEIARPQAASEGLYVDLLATTLGGLAAALGDLGQFNLALSTAEEALHYLRELVEFGGDYLGQRRKLASALNNVSTQYGALERFEESVERAREAIDLLISELDSAEDLELFAAAQNNLALSSYRAGDLEVALPAALESVRANEELLDVSPDWQRTQLARALLNLSLIQHGAEKHDEAADAARRAALIAADSSFSDPELYANCLGVLTSRLLAAGKPGAAAESGRQAVAEMRSLVDAGKADEATLATTLNILASALRESGEDDQASAVAREARRIFSQAMRPFPPKE